MNGIFTVIKFMVEDIKYHKFNKDLLHIKSGIAFSFLFSQSVYRTREASDWLRLEFKTSVRSWCFFFNYNIFQVS